MRTKTAVLLFAAAALACHGRQQTAQRAQQQYDVIQEGQTTSASTTVGAPGEQVRPPVATATNTDTTGSFTLSTAAPAANMPGGPATGVLPPQQPGAMTAGSPPPAPMASGAPPLRVPPQPAPIAVSRTPRRPPPPAPPTSDTTTSGETTGTSGTTDTTATSTQPPPTDTTSTQKPKKSKDKRDGDQPPPTDTSTTTAPPPPTQTDTIGDHR